MYSVHSWNCAPMIRPASAAGQSEGTGTNAATSSMLVSPPIDSGSRGSADWAWSK